jgi:hypothetical protein
MSTSRASPHRAPRRFLHTHAPPYRSRLAIPPPFISDARLCNYNKTEKLSQADTAYDSPFTHVIAESRDALLPGRWQVIDVIDGIRGWRVRKDVLELVNEKGLKRLWRALEITRKICCGFLKGAGYEIVNVRSYNSSLFICFTPWVDLIATHCITTRGSLRPI